MAIFYTFDNAALWIIAMLHFLIIKKLFLVDIALYNIRKSNYMERPIMIFFINESMPANKSGIEHAELKRINLFKKMHQPAKLILRDYDSQTHYLTNLAHLNDDDVINMFDYFQQTMQVESKQLTAKDINFGIDNLKLVEDFTNNRYLVQKPNHQLVARINIDMSTKQVKSTELFDAVGNLYCVNQYDVRGFLSCRQWYTTDNKIGTEEWVNLDNQTVLQHFYKYNVRQELKDSNWVLTDKQQTFFFDTKELLTKHFLDDINDQYFSEKEPNIFILDRNHLADWALLHLKRPAYRVIHLHNSQTVDSNDPLHSALNQHYEYSLQHMDEYDAFISATHKQNQDVKTRFKPKAQLFTIPVGIVPDKLLNAPKIPINERTFGKMVVFARIAYEKHLDDLVRAIAMVHKVIPQITLDIYGYADPSNDYQAKKAVQKVIAENHLEKVVSFKGYTNQIDEVENKAMMYGLTSRMEGFNLAIMEGIAHGLIGFTYDVNYGPNEIIQDGRNGRVVPNHDYKAMAQAIIDVLRDKKLAQQYSTGAYESAQRYSDEQVWQDWQALINDAQQKWPQLKAKGDE